MNYITYKSRYLTQVVQTFNDNGLKRRGDMFKNHSILVDDTDKALINTLEETMRKEKEKGVQRTVFTPEEFVEIMTPENAYFEHKTQGKIPFKRLSKMIDFALENGFKDEEQLIEVKGKKVEHGTTTSATQLEKFKTK